MSGASFRAWLRVRRVRHALLRIRRELRFWGWDTSDLSDEELEERILLASRIVARVGMTLAEAAALGNAQVPIVAASVWRRLMRESLEDSEDRTGEGARFGR